MIYKLVMECRGKVSEPWESGYRITTPPVLKRTSRTRSGREIRPWEDRSVYKHSTSALAIAFTCRELYPESTRVWYSTVMFSFEWAETMESFIRSITIDNLNAIRRIKLNLAEYFRENLKRDVPRMLDLTEEFSGLRELDLHVGCSRDTSIWNRWKSQGAIWLKRRLSVRKVTLLGSLDSQGKCKRRRHGKWCLREATVLRIDESSGEVKEEETYA